VGKAEGTLRADCSSTIFLISALACATASALPVMVTLFDPSFGTSIRAPDHLLFF